MDNLNKWLTVIANFGVLLGLAALVYELRQSQNLAETQAAVMRLDQMQAAQLEMATSESLADIRVRALSEGVNSLSPTELYRLQRWENSVRHRMRGQYIQYVRGYLDKDTVDRMLDTAAGFLPYWEELGFEFSNDDFDRALREVAGR